MMFPWLRLQKESSRAYQAFEAYRDMGPGRSVEKVAIRLHKNPTALRRLCARHNWVSRANAYDVYMGQIKIQKMEKEIAEMDRRHARQARTFQEDALHLCNRLKKRIEEGPISIFDEDFDHIKITKAVQLIFQFFRMYSQAAGIERAARGGGEKWIKHNVSAEAASCPAHEKEPKENHIDQDRPVIQEKNTVEEKDGVEGEVGMVKDGHVRPRYEKRLITVVNDSDDSGSVCEEPQGVLIARKENGAEDG